MLARALRITQEDREGTRYNVFFPRSNGETSVRLGVGNVVGALTHLRLDGNDAEEVLDISYRQVPEEGYAQLLFEHGFIPADRLQDAQRTLDENEPGTLVTVFVPHELEHLRRIVYNTMIVCSQSVHGTARISGQKVPEDSAAAILTRGKFLLSEVQYKRLLADFSQSLADDCRAQMEKTHSGEQREVQRLLTEQAQERAEAAHSQALQAEKEEEMHRQMRTLSAL